MTRIYHGDPVPEHDCHENMRRRCEHYVEMHCLDCPPYEEWDEEWWECATCGEREEEDL